MKYPVECKASSHSSTLQSDNRYTCPSDIDLIFKPSNDPVNHPSHYTNGSVECIDAIESALGSDEFHGYLRGNIIKYLWRYELKNKRAEDLKKARWYLNKLIASIENEMSEQ